MKSGPHFSDSSALDTMSYRHGCLTAARPTFRTYFSWTVDAVVPVAASSLTESVDHALHTGHTLQFLSAGFQTGKCEARQPGQCGS